MLTHSVCVYDIIVPNHLMHTNDCFTFWLYFFLFLIRRIVRTCLYGSPLLRSFLRLSLPIFFFNCLLVAHIPPACLPAFTHSFVILLMFGCGYNIDCCCDCFAREVHYAPLVWSWPRASASPITDELIVDLTMTQIFVFFFCLLLIFSLSSSWLPYFY